MVEKPGDRVEIIIPTGACGNIAGFYFKEKINRVWRYFSRKRITRNAAARKVYTYGHFV